jgi:hypothetical protein
MDNFGGKPAAELVGAEVITGGIKTAHLRVQKIYSQPNVFCNKVATL